VGGDVGRAAVHGRLLVRQPLATDLPVAAFNRLFDEWLAEVLGDALLLEWAAPSKLPT